MDLPSINKNSKNLSLIILLWLFVSCCIVVFLDIMIARQIICFLYITFVPGFFILKILKMDKLDEVEKLLFSVGLSIAFLMLAGLLLSDLFLVFGIAEPLSLMPLMLVLSSFVLLGGFLVYLRSDGINVLIYEVRRSHLFAIAFMVLPILSIIGALWVTTFENNLILLFMITTIPLLLVVVVVSNRLVPTKLYPFIVVMIAISLLFHSSLISNYIVHFGSDVPVEHFVFKITQNNAYWSSDNPYFGDLVHNRFYSMLSVTILPTFYSEILNLDSTWFFKIISPLIFCFVPLGLYQIWKGYMGKKYALISTFLFMAQQTFYTEMLGLGRQMVGELFFVLLLLIVLNKKMNSPSKTVCFILFSFGLVTSHYGLSEIFLFFISFAFISLLLIKRSSKNITAIMILSFFVIMFSWYIFTSGSAVFDSILEYGDYVYRQLGDFFNPASRGQTVLRGLGLESPPTIWNAISRAFAYATQFLIVVGFIGLLTKRARMNVEREHFIFSFLAMAFLATLILVPGLANTMNMTRFYHILLFFLAPLCVIGAEVLVKLVSKRKEEFRTSILLLIVLVPYFLFQIGFVYEITGSESWSVPLSGYRMGPKLPAYYGVVTDQEVVGAQWLSQYGGIEVKGLRVHVDVYARSALDIYGMIPRFSQSSLSNVTVVRAGEVVYLGRLNTFYEIVIGMDIWNTTSISDSVLSDVSIIYSNGDCEIYKNTNK